MSPQGIIPVAFRIRGILQTTFPAPPISLNRVNEGPCDSTHTPNAGAWAPTPSSDESCGMVSNPTATGDPSGRSCLSPIHGWPSTTLSPNLLRFSSLRFPRSSGCLGRKPKAVTAIASTVPITITLRATIFATTSSSQSHDPLSVTSQARPRRIRSDGRLLLIPHEKKELHDYPTRISLGYRSHPHGS